MGDCPLWQPSITAIIVQYVTDVFTWLINSLSPLIQLVMFAEDKQVIRSLFLGDSFDILLRNVSACTVRCGLFYTC